MHTSPFVMFRAEYISPNDPLPIFRTNRYLPPTVKSDLDAVLALAMMNKKIIIII